MLWLGVLLLIVSLGQLWFLAAIWWGLRRLRQRSLDLPVGGGGVGDNDDIEDAYYGIGYLRGDI